MAPTALTAETITASFPDIPPFPNDVPTAPLLRLSYARLQSSDPEIAKTELDAFFQASKDLGFFYLDMRGHPLGEEILAESEKLFGVGKDLFKEGAEELGKYDYSGQMSYMGYKSVGKGVVDAAGNRDRNEFYNAGKDDFLGQSGEKAFKHPKTLMGEKELIASYSRHSHELLTSLLTHLNAKLELPTGTLEALHKLEDESGDHVRWVHSPVQPPSDLRTALGAHTDFGSLTLLFNRLGGLQVLLPKVNEWAYVRPLPGHAIVNLADALVKFSGGILRSNIHRVASPPGEQSGEERYSLVYFMRPADHVPLKRVKGGIVPPVEDGVVEEDVSAKQWIIDKAIAGTKKQGEAGAMTKSRVTNEAEIGKGYL